MNISPVHNTYNSNCNRTNKSNPTFGAFRVPDISTHEFIGKTAKGYDLDTFNKIFLEEYNKDRTISLYTIFEGYKEKLCGVYKGTRIEQEKGQNSAEFFEKLVQKVDNLQKAEKNYNWNNSQ